MSDVRKKLLEKGLEIALGSNVAVTAFADVTARMSSMPCRLCSPTRITGEACVRSNICRI